MFIFGNSNSSEENIKQQIVDNMIENLIESMEENNIEVLNEEEQIEDDVDENNENEVDDQEENDEEDFTEDRLTLLENRVKELENLTNLHNIPIFYEDEYYEFEDVYSEENKTDKNRIFVITMNNRPYRYTNCIKEARKSMDDMARKAHLINMKDYDGYIHFIDKNELNVFRTLDYILFKYSFEIYNFKIYEIFEL